ncbi:unnamed protein product [Aureobasidium pullulans]|nr:unnamed protein product [Aureobasidium pullulans]
MADQTGLEFIAFVAIVTFCLVLCLKFSLVLLRGNVYLLCTVVPVVFLVLAVLREFEEALHIRLAKEISDPAARAKDIQNVETIKNGDTANTLPHEKHTRSTTRKRVRDSGKKNKSACSAIIANHEHLDTDERQAISLSLSIQLNSTQLSTNLTTSVNMIGMMLLALIVHFLCDPTATYWLLIFYLIYYDVRGIRRWLVRLALTYMHAGE